MINDLFATHHAPRRIEAGVMLETGLADALSTVDSPVGPLHVAFNETGVSASSLADRSPFQRMFEQRFGRPLIPVEAPPKTLAGRLDRAMAEHRVGSLPLDLRGVSEFQRKVLNLIASIPPGEVRPYGWVAEAVGHPGAARAVGTTMATNPIPVILPCHRVVRASGDIGSYLFGPQVKAALLAAEGMDVERHERDVAAGRRLKGSDTTKIVCFPTCRHARRTTTAHAVWFRDAAQAAGAGYRPCKVCRPTVSA